MSSPHEIALREVHALLASATQSAASGRPSDLGAAAAQAESALKLLNAMAPSGGAEIHRLRARAWLQHGQAFEALGSASAVAEAIQSYGQAIGLLRESAADPELQHRRDLAVALMNRGNARQRLGSTDDLAGAVHDYDETIALQQQLPIDNIPALRNTLGAAWMNRGGALERQATPASFAEALRSFEEATACLRKLPLDDERSYRVNLAAAWMNRGHALLMHDAGHRAGDARNAAHEAIALTRPLERDQADAADVGVRARNVLGRAISALFAHPAGDAPASDELFAEGTDAIDDAMALARRWNMSDRPHARELLAELFRFGALLYLVHQPHFLAEYVLETLDPERSPDALRGNPAMLEAALEIVGKAVAALERPRFLHSDMPDIERQMETLRDLHATRARLQELHGPA